MRSDGGTVMWACAQTLPSNESRALRNLRNQNYEAFFPFFFQRAKRKARSLVRPVFPGYVFIKIPPVRNWSPINHTYGVLRLLTKQAANDEYRQPWNVPEDFIRSMRRYIIESNRVIGDPLHVGVRVRILVGSFINQEALITWRDEDRVGLLMAVLGREVEIEFSLDDIQEIEAAA